MKIKDMEPQIDALGLKKLEVKMKKGRQVHFFICGFTKDSGYKTESRVLVFDENGAAWQSPQMKWEIGDTFNITEETFKGEKLLWINGKPMGRFASFDLEHK